MPTYSARCRSCGSEQDFIAAVANRDETPVHCAKQMERVLSAPMIAAIGIADHNMVVSPIDGKPLYGRSEFLATLKKHNVLPSSELAGEAEYRQAQNLEVAKAARKETIAEAIAQHGG